MPMILSAAFEYGGYISAVKLILMILLFFLWMPLVNWIYNDTQAVRTRVLFWTTIVATTGGVAFFVWLFVPMFIIGFLIYLISVGTVSLVYVMHRNTRVADFEKVLTSEHIKSFFVNEAKRIEKASKGMGFVTANGNEVPIPSPKSPEAIGFKMACEIFDDAIWRRTVSIVFKPTQQDYSVVYNIDGEIAKQPPRTKEDMEYFSRYMKLLADLDTNERRKPQKGNFKAVKDGVPYGWEITTAGSTAGEHVTFSKTGMHTLMTIEQIGLNADQVEPVESLSKLETGLVVVSGPPKSGVTTTLYALLQKHDPFMNNINTLEKNPTSELPNITQQIFTLSDTGTTTYPKKLQSVLRMGPDIIGIADCNDANCASLATNAAKEGMIVYAELEATSVLAALKKWLTFVPDKDLVVENLVAIINQRLVRILCTDCKQAYQPNEDLFRKFNITSDKIKVLYRPGEIEYNRHGKPLLCEKCQGTGFSGRIGIFEIILINDELKKAIRAAKSMQEIASHFRRAGMLYLQEQSIKKVAEGVTSINEVIRKFAAEQNAARKNKQ